MIPNELVVGGSTRSIIPLGHTPMSSPGKSGFSFSKFPEGGLIVVIIALGLLLAIFGGSVQLPKFEVTPDGKRVRVFETNPDGRKVPAFETVNKFFNARTIVQIAKDTSFFAIMAVGMTVVIITGGIDLSVGAIYALASVSGALVFSPYGPSGGGGATVRRNFSHDRCSDVARFSQRRDDYRL